MQYRHLSFFFEMTELPRGFEENLILSQTHNYKRNARKLNTSLPNSHLSSCSNLSIKISDPKRRKS